MDETTLELGIIIIRIVSEFPDGACVDILDNVS